MSMRASRGAEAVCVATGWSMFRELSWGLCWLIRTRFGGCVWADVYLSTESVAESLRRDVVAYDQGLAIIAVAMTLIGFWVIAFQPLVVYHSNMIADYVQLSPLRFPTTSSAVRAQLSTAARDSVLTCGTTATTR
eukprot:43542-Rhodomonas_salina.1